MVQQLRRTRLESTTIRNYGVDADDVRSSLPSLALALGLKLLIGFAANKESRRAFSQALTPAWTAEG